jgi:hypothetical protein
MDKRTTAERHRRATRVMELLRQLVALGVPWAVLNRLVLHTQTNLCPHVEYESKHGLRRCFTCGLWHQKGDSNGR